MNLPAISVAMSVYNCAPYLEMAIASILNQTFTDFEFLILDDGSSDESATIIDRFAASDDRIAVIRRENRGLIDSLNELIAKARGVWIARMDGDDIAHPDRFAKQIAFLKANPGYGVLGTWTADIDEAGAPFPIEGEDHPTNYADFLEIIGTRSALCHPSVMMRRDLVQAVGGYHAAFKHCEDYDLWLRLADKTMICSLPERLINYRHTAGQVSNRYAFEQQYGAVVSRLAFHERRNGRIDPTEHLAVLPPINALNDLFGRSDVEQHAREMLVSGLLYSKTGLDSGGFKLLLDHVRSGGVKDGLWRTVLRLAIRMGLPLRAAKLAAALLRH